MNALDKQVDGNHYKKFQIQPIEFIEKNSIPFIEGNIIKYIARHADKNGARDVEKVIHYCELLLQLRYGKLQNVVEKAAAEVQNAEELNAIQIANLVTESMGRKIILKKIVYDMIKNGATQELEDTINEAVANHQGVNTLLTTYLDILLREA